MNLPKDLYSRIRLLREAGNVRRCHTLTIIGDYTVGKHSHDALSILLVLHPNPSLQLIRHVAWHDSAERWIGDWPSPVKRAFPTLWPRDAEEALLTQLGVPTNGELTQEEHEWATAVDLLEFLFWCEEQAELGNRVVGNARAQCVRALCRRRDEGLLPSECRDILPVALTREWERSKSPDMGDAG